MAKEETARWCCANRDCNWFMVATKTPEGAAAPSCVCGRLMKKVEMLPVLNYLDFLHDESVVAEKVSTDEE